MGISNVKKMIGALAFFSACSVFAKGGMEGGGGIGAVCPGSNGSWKFETLDLHEGRLRGLTYNHVPTSDPEIADLIATAASDYYWTSWWGVTKSDYADSIRSQAILALNGQNFTNSFSGEKIFVKFVNSLPLSNDHGQYSIKPGCHLEQIAYFDDDVKTIFFAKPKWDELDGLNKAALLLHEVVYWENRHQGLENAGTGVIGPISSEKSRQFVSSLLSTSGISPRYEGVDKGQFHYCYTDSPSNKFTNFFLYSSSPSEVTAVFIFVADYYSVYSTRVRLPISLEKLLDASQGSLRLSAPISLIGEMDPPDIKMDLNKSVDGMITVSFSRGLNGFFSVGGGMLGVRT